MKNSGIKLETLRKSYVKPILVGVVVFVILMSTVILRGTMAKYVYKQSVKLAEGTINYKMPDFNLIALYIQDESGEYVSASTVPSEGYSLNEEKSYCEKLETDGSKTTLSDVTIEYKDGALYFGEVTQTGTKGYVYFDTKNNDCTGLACNYILANKTINVRDDFSTVFTSDTTGTVYQAEDDDGTTYYFAGATNENYVYFANLYWRIIRVNGDGTVRLIYNGTSTEATGTGTQISESAFNSSGNDNAYVGFMYGTTGSSTYASTHTNTNNSTIKGVLDTWYSNNLASYSSYIDTNAGFCGDRTSTTSDSGTATNGTSGGYGTTETYYGGYLRIVNSKNPTFKCAQTNDLYTMKGATKGNKALTYPIGLITIDEVNYAGLGWGGRNQSFYLYTNQGYWTMTPMYLNDSDSARVWYVISLGYLNVNSPLTSAYGVRPVINLRSDVKLSGSGTASDPFVVVGA